MPHAARVELLLDCDGIMADWLGSALIAIHAVTGKLYTPESFPTWDIFDVVGREHAAACNEHFHAPGFCTNILPYPAALAGVRRLQESHSNVDIHVLTSPAHSPFWYYERAEWVQKHFGIATANVIQTKHKERYRGDVFVDDHPAHAISWANAHPEGISLLWDAPYNQKEMFQLAKHGNVRRIKTWAEVYGCVRAKQMGMSLSPAK